MARPRRKRRRPHVLVPLVSMGDIAFLMIIFFILIGDMGQTGIQLTPPVSADLRTVDPTALVVAIDDENRVFFQGIEVGPGAGLETALDAALARAETPLQRTVWFRCDRAVPREVFEPVLEVISEAGGRIAAIGIPGPEGADGGTTAAD